ncbi:FecR family protein [Pedobacter heparinus]|uniref:FecR family protein n=1 Tax=Pedobacter heparinus TaxID=984 RepID=UPI00292EDFB5|nr:FecR domain-containing protein [Pedobacter heparinus]
MLDIKDKIRLQELAHKWLKGSLTIAEQQEFDLWFKQAHDNPLKVPEAAALDEQSHERALFAKIQAELGIIPQPKTVKLWPRMIGVAAAVAVIVFGVWFYNSKTEILRSALDDKNMVVNDIAPGKNTATIKFGDGEAITLSDKQTGVIVAADNLTYTDGSTILSSRANAKDLLNSSNKRSLPYGRDDGRVQMLTVTTPRGGTYQVTLPDGTKVWLNAASVLIYTMPLNERGGVRLVELSGEAYFEVFRNKNQPFVVTTKNLTTTVLGTHFNISAYEDEGSTKATLLEGSVRVHYLSSRVTAKDLDPSKVGMTKETKDDIILKPNQQAYVTGSSGLAVKQVDASEAIDWKNGKFVFAMEDIRSLMRKVARWYDVEVIYEGNIDNKTIGGSVSRYKNVSEVLDMLSATKTVQFKIEGRKITVMPYKN